MFSLGRRREGKRDRGQILGNASLHFIPRMFIEFSDKQKFGFGMLENVLDRVSRECWINGNGDVTGHLNGQIGNDPPSTILATKSNGTAGREMKRREVVCHFLGFFESFGKRPVLDVTIGASSSHGLRHETSIGHCFDIAKKGVNESRMILLFRHDDDVCSCMVRTRSSRTSVQEGIHAFKCEQESENRMSEIMSKSEKMRVEPSDDEPVALMFAPRAIHE